MFIASVRLIHSCSWTVKSMGGRGFQPFCELSHSYLICCTARRSGRVGNDVIWDAYDGAVSFYVHEVVQISGYPPGFFLGFRDLEGISGHASFCVPVLSRSPRSLPSSSCLSSGFPRHGFPLRVTRQVPMSSLVSLLTQLNGKVTGRQVPLHRHSERAVRLPEGDRSLLWVP